MCNIGVKLSAEDLGATNTNTWHIPIAADGDAFQPLEAFFENPLGDNVDIPVFITFPSTKDLDWVKNNPKKTSVQMLVGILIIKCVMVIILIEIKLYLNF